MNWSENPPSQAETFPYRLARVPAARPLQATIISSKAIGCNTHYYKGRTTPCPENNCEACTAGLPYRWHSYTAIKLFPTGENLILELTAQATEQLKAAVAEYKTLRAVKIMVERPSKRPNGRIRLHIVPGRAPEKDLPEEPDVPRLMQHIWGLDDQPVATQPHSTAVNRLTQPPKPNGDLLQSIGSLP